MSWKNKSSSLLLLSVALAAAGLVDSAADSAESGLPQIESIHVGIANHYKVGHWTPVQVEVDGITRLQDPQMTVTVPDSDGVATTTAAALTESSSPEGNSTALAYTKIGRLGAPIDVALVDGEQRVTEQSLRTRDESNTAARFVELPATSELLLFLSSAPFEMQAAYTKRDAATGHFARRAMHVSRSDDLPRDWFGYDAVDVLILIADDSRLPRQLAADKARFSALVQWVELGGRLVILCGGENAQEVLGEGGPLAALLPGKMVEVARLPETGRLEHFAGSEQPITARGGRATLVVPRLVGVEGSIEAYAGQRPTDLPLVVRAPRGLGEIAFAGVDLSKAPLAEWPGRAAFLQALLRPYLADDGSDSATQTLVTRGYNDLSGALRQRLGRSFTGVSPIGFSVVTMLAIAYVLVLGPLDYFIVHRWLGRPLVAWITFPLIVLLFGGAAFVLADWRTGDGGPRLNGLELVDVDTMTGQARGTYWAALYSPHAERFDLRLDVDSLADRPAPADLLLSWWGLPGAGIGGTQSRGMDLGVVRGGYRFAPDLAALENVPVLPSGTKSFVARWTSPIGPFIAAELTDENGLVAGSVENRTGRPFRNVRLFYNGWAYRLGNLDDGKRINVEEQFTPRRVKTIVMQDALGAAAAEESVFVAERASAEQILNIMMFYEAAGGFGFAQLPNRYEAYCDFSRLLNLGRAIVVADVQTPGSRLVDAESGWPIDQGDPVVVYRFVLPVRRE